MQICVSWRLLSRSPSVIHFGKYLDRKLSGCWPLSRPGGGKNLAICGEANIFWDMRFNLKKVYFKSKHKVFFFY